MVKPKSEMMTIRSGPARLDKRQRRIEALRAASRIIAGVVNGEKDLTSLKGGLIPDSTIEIAEQFAKWLETGEK